MESESTSFNPRTWISPGAMPEGGEPAASATAAEPAPEPERKRPVMIMLGGGFAGLALMAALALLGPWNASADAPEQERAITAADAAPVVAEPAYATRIFLAADMNELGANLEGMGIPTGDAFVVAEEVVAALGAQGRMNVSVELDRRDEKVAIHALTAELENGAAVRLVRAGGGTFRRENVVETAQVRLQQASGVIKHSTFYASAVEADIPNGLVSDFTKAFSFDVDWGQIKQGDRFRAIWEETVTLAGREVEAPRLIAVEYERDGVKHSFFAFTPPEESEPRWFDERGQGNARALMVTPVESARISSRFGVRFHPISKIQKNHNGVDFAAPTGTDIYAAGKGTIIKRAMSGGAGNLVIIDHGGGLQTRYMHLDAFADGQAVGSDVVQGQVIGYVGTTGGSTGPHLHFEILTDGEYVDPLSFDNTVTEALTAEALIMFKNERKARMMEIAQLNRPAAPKAKGPTPKPATKLPE